MNDVNSVGILVFDDVEELDFVGPLEVYVLDNFRLCGLRSIVSLRR